MSDNASGICNNKFSSTLEVHILLDVLHTDASISELLDPEGNRKLSNLSALKVDVKMRDFRIQ